ncbi:MAG: hypothetical protein ABI587_00885 [Gemmatimonadales bacterium]|jgi:hypothetical protein
MAYNIRKNKSVDHEPASGNERKLNGLREVGSLAFGLLVMFLVYLLVRRFLF